MNNNNRNNLHIIEKEIHADDYYSRLGVDLLAQVTLHSRSTIQDNAGSQNIFFTYTHIYRHTYVYI